MVKSCVVPRCKTGKTKVTEKCSVFKVPLNNELYEKWKAVIPGFVQLKQTHYVCERHFEERYILRKWIKHDSKGQIIAEAQYARPRLDPSAVPSIFSSNAAKQPCAARSINDDVLAEKLSTEEPVLADKDHSLVDLSLIEPADTSKNCWTDFQSPRDPLSDNGTFAEVFSNTERISSTINLNDNEVDEPSFVQQSTEFHQEVFPSIRIVDINSISDRTFEGHSEEGSALATFPKSVDISKASMSGITADGRYFSISIPSPWSISKSATAEGQIILLSHFVMKTENRIKLPVLEKSVTINPDYTLCYCVYGRVVDARAANLAQTFDKAVLPESLKRFKSMGLCNGVGVMNAQHVDIENVFKDYVDRWHHKNCTLISNWKRCGFCMKLRNLVRKREVRFQAKKALARTY